MSRNRGTTFAKNHPFVDGNKRTALAATLAFLGLNGWRVRCKEDALADLVLGVAEGRHAKADAAVFLRKHSRPR